MVRIPTCFVLGSAVRQARQDAGLTQAELAAQAGVSRPWLSQLENGKRSVEVGKVLAVLAALDLYMDIGRAPQQSRRPSVDDVLADHAGP